MNMFTIALTLLLIILSLISNRHKDHILFKKDRQV